MDRVDDSIQTTRSGRYTHYSQLTTHKKSGKRDSNPRPLVWETNALPTELFPLINQIYK